jgi:general secretion pathway protein H
VLSTPSRTSSPQRGFTLLELMVVVSIVALATAGVSLTLRDNDGNRLETEALRLSALLESARAQSRSSGVPVYWRPTAEGFEFLGAPARPQAPASLANERSWLHPETRVQIAQPTGASSLVLGPEPLIAAQRLRLMHGEHQLTLGTDGLSPFAVLPEAAAP